MRRHVYLLLLLLLGAGAEAARGQEAVVLQRLTGPVQLDGRPDEAAWQAIDPLPLVVNMPSYGEAPSERTEIRVAYDDAFLYLAARCYVDASTVFGTSFKRDIFTTGTDYVGLTLDTYDDNENAVNFSVTPTGARLDYTIFGDAQGAVPVSASWNSFWDAQVVQTEEGWFAEMRIPFTSLRFQDEGGQVRMGMIAYRWISQKAEMLTYPPIDPKWGFWSFIKPSLAADVELTGVHSRKPLYVAPYLLGGASQSFELNEAETAYRRHDEPTYDVGLDLKYGLTSNLTLDLTVNTDFAQVEADDQQVNLTRFSLFFPEKRLFFQERASIFDFGQPEPASVVDFFSFSSSQLFYSRRIGLHEGQAVRMLGGARVVGRVGGWDVGLMGVQTGRIAELPDDGGSLPSENFGVARLRRQLFNPYSYGGGMVTSRIGLDGRYNVAYGLDGLLRLFGNDYLALAWSQTLDDGTGAASPVERSRAHLRWERRTFSGFGYDVSASRSGSAYIPGMGFLLREDYTRLGDRIFYGWTPGAGSPLQRHQLSLNGAAYLRNRDGSVESLEGGPAWEGSTKAGTTLRAAVALAYEDVREGFDLSDDVGVPVGRYRFADLRGRHETPGGRLLRVSTTAAAGSFYDGVRFSVGAEPRWIVSRHLEVSLFYGLNHIRFGERAEVLTAHVGRLRVLAALDTRLSAGAFVQYNSSHEAVAANVRLRYNPREGVDLYLVYNEGLHTHRHRYDPVLPLTSSRTLLLKYTYTFPF